MMEENDNRSLEEKFLDEFKELEVYIVAKCNLKDEFISFSRALTNIHNQDLDPVIENDMNYEFLKSANDLRNILSHRNDVCVPTEEFYNKFVKLKKRIISPTSAYDIATKNVLSVNYSTTVKEAIDKMISKSLSHLPILIDGRVVGVFSRSTLFDVYARRGNLKLDHTYTIADFKEFCEIQNHNNESFLFVSRDSTVFELFKKIKKKTKHEKKIVMMFVTENGDIKEKLLGIITDTDLIIGEKNEH